MQHDALSWQVLGTSFIRTERSDLGRFFDISLRNWIGSMTDEEMKDFTDALFGMLSAGGARTLSELRKDPLRTVSEIFKVSKNMSPEEFQEFTSVIVRLVKSGLTTFREQSEEKITAVVAGAGTNAQKSRSKTGGKGRTKSGFKSPANCSFMTTLLPQKGHLVEASVSDAMISPAHSLHR